MVTVEEAAQKRYEGLMAVRNKAIKGKGAWYWVHLEPVLVQSVDTGRYEAVKLRCSLCDAVFSASNPSRTATEHLKRGICLKFTSCVAVANALSASSPKPISSITPCSSAATTAVPHHNRKVLSLICRCSFLPCSLARHRLSFSLLLLAHRLHLQRCGSLCHTLAAASATTSTVVRVDDAG